MDKSVFCNMHTKCLLELYIKMLCIWLWMIFSFYLFIQYLIDVGCVNGNKGFPFTNKHEYEIRGKKLYRNCICIVYMVQVFIMLRAVNVFRALQLEYVLQIDLSINFWYIHMLTAEPRYHPNSTPYYLIPGNKEQPWV